jgi:hypothetical protein
VMGVLVIALNIMVAITNQVLFWSYVVSHPGSFWVYDVPFLVCFRFFLSIFNIGVAVFMTCSSIRTYRSIKDSRRRLEEARQALEVAREAQRRAFERLLIAQNVPPDRLDAAVEQLMIGPTYIHRFADGAARLYPGAILLVNADEFEVMDDGVPTVFDPVNLCFRHADLLSEAQRKIASEKAAANLHSIVTALNCKPARGTRYTGTAFQLKTKTAEFVVDRGHIYNLRTGENTCYQISPSVPHAEKIATALLQLHRDPKMFDFLKDNHGRYTCGN